MTKPSSLAKKQRLLTRLTGKEVLPDGRLVWEETRDRRDNPRPARQPATAVTLATGLAGPIGAVATVADCPPWLQTGGDCVPSLDWHLL